MRQRDSQFVLSVMNEMDANGGKLTDDVKMAAARLSYGCTTSDGAALRKAESKLAMPEIKRALADYIEELSTTPEEQGLNHGEAMRLWVKHIRGRFTKIVLDKDGDPKEVEIPPSYAALKDYVKLTTPEAPRQLQVQSINLHRTERVNRTEATPQIRARTIGDTYDNEETE